MYCCSLHWLISIDISIAELLFVNFDDYILLFTVDLCKFGAVELLVEDQLKFVFWAEFVHNVLALGEVLRWWENWVNCQP